MRLVEEVGFSGARSDEGLDINANKAKARISFDNFISSSPFLVGHCIAHTLVNQRTTDCNLPHRGDNVKG